MTPVFRYVIGSDSSMNGVIVEVEICNVLTQL